MSPRILPILALLSLPLAACMEDDGSEREQLGEKSDSFDNGTVSDQSDFFAPDGFWFFQIRGIDGSLLNNTNLLDNGEPREVCFEEEGATLLIARVDPTSPEQGPERNDSAQGCYDIDKLEAENKVVYKTDTFCFRMSGNLTLGTPKPSFKLKLGTKGSDNKKFAGMKKINLKSMWNDVSQMRESIAWNMFDKAQLPASRHTYARLCMDPKGEGQKNNVYRGLYSVIEQVGKNFLKDREVHFGDQTKGNLYKGAFGDVGPANLSYRGEAGSNYYGSGERTYDLKTNDDDDELNTYADLAKFIAVVNGKTLPDDVQAKGDDCTRKDSSGHADCMFNTSAYENAMREIFDAEAFLRWAGLNVNVGAWDNYWRTPANYYLYNSGRSGDPEGFMGAPYFHWVPWDMDNVLGIDYFRQDWARACTDLPNCNPLLNWERTAAAANGGQEPALPLIRNLLGNDNFLRYYADWIEYSRTHVFHPKLVDEYIGDRGTGHLWDRIRTSAFMEDAAFCQPDKNQVCSGNPKTGRAYSNDQVYHNGFRHDELADGSVSANVSQFTLGIHHFLEIRRQLLDGELNQLRELRKIGRGQSGVVFPVAPTPVP